MLTSYFEESPHKVSLKIGDTEDPKTIWFSLVDKREDEVKTETEGGTVEEGDQAGGSASYAGAAAGETTANYTEILHQQTVNSWYGSIKD